MVPDGTTLIITADSDLFRFLRGMQPSPSSHGNPFIRRDVGPEISVQRLL
jgi:hypothetical protein